ncbi:MAG: sulfatase [Verrucomicrobiota bacterium]
MRIISARAIVIVASLAGTFFGMAADRPNVLAIAIDDLNDWVGVLEGHPLARTPHIDALAKRGTVFLNAHCQAPLCNPSRTSVLLGRRPSTTGIYGLKPWFRDVEDLQDSVTLPAYFARHGYHTFGVGKVFHSRFGFREGDEEFHQTGPTYDDGPFPQKRMTALPGRPSKGNDWGPVAGPDERRGDWKIASWAIDQLEKQPSGPFFLSVGIRLPHLPLFAPPKWFDRFPEQQVDLLPRILDHDRNDTPRFSWYLHWNLPEYRLQPLRHRNEWRSKVRAYLACVSFLDDQVGRILTALRKQGLEENTVVVLWSDHGYHLGEKEITGKNSLWEESTRVPFIFAGPGVTPGGRCHEPVELLDLYPTLIELCGLPKNPQTEGHALQPQLADARTKRTRPAITTANPDNHSIRSRNYRYIQYADGSEEFYDHRKDPDEWHNLAGKAGYLELINEHKRWLPGKQVPLAPGSKGRILEWQAGKAIWEGKEISAEAPIPGL